jgi:hypothetical protein
MNLSDGVLIRCLWLVALIGSVHCVYYVIRRLVISLLASCSVVYL